MTSRSSWRRSRRRGLGRHGRLRARGRRPRQVRRQPCHASGPPRRSDHLRPSRPRRPRMPIVAEEAAASGQLMTVAERFLLVDPLDGTKEFLGAQRRVHHQCRADRTGASDRRRRLRARTRAAVVRRRCAPSSATRRSARPARSHAVAAHSRSLRARRADRRSRSRSHCDSDTEAFLARCRSPSAARQARR